jgi:hypothetical protein
LDYEDIVSSRHILSLQLVFTIFLYNWKLVF